MTNDSCADTLIDRRAFLNAATGLAVAAGSAAGHQDGPPRDSRRVQGPRVWLEMDQQQLDDAYTQSTHAPNWRQVVGRYATNSEIARQRLGPPRREAYGRTPAEGLDVYTTSRPNAPVMVFLHGGAWRAASARNYAFPAELFVRAGAHYIVADFIDVDAAGGSLLPMAEQVRTAVAWVYRNARTFGGDPDRLYLSGFSSGGHLAGVVLTTPWGADFGLPADVVKGGLCCSGIYDLKPVRLSIRSSYVKFTDEIEQALSPQRHVDRLGCPLVLAHGTLETPEFQRQSRDFAAAIRAAGKPVELLVGEGYNHFEMIETLASPYGLLGHAALRLMALA